LNLTTWVQRGASIAGMPNLPKTIADRPINMPPLKKKQKNCEHKHDPINMNRTILY
jgi:hypothetical protein